MTLTSVKTTLVSKSFAAIATMFVVGGSLLFVAGHAQSAGIHDVAHDMRHATGFPCH